MDLKILKGGTQFRKSFHYHTKQEYVLNIFELGNLNLDEIRKLKKMV